MTIKHITSIAAATAVIVALAACGTTGTNETPGAGLASGGSTGRATQASVDVVAADCSSFRSKLMAFVPDMAAVAMDAAKKQHRFLATCFDGAPARTLTWPINVNFAEQVPGVDRTLTQKVNIVRALGLRPKLQRMVQMPERVPGSGQLELLEALSQTDGLGRAYVFTDAIPNEVDGINLTTATDAEISRVMRLWVPRMGSGLRDASITFVGVGLGTYRTANVRKARVLFGGIIKGAGARFTWVPELPQLTS